MSGRVKIGTGQSGYEQDPVSLVENRENIKYKNQARAIGRLGNVTTAREVNEYFRNCKL